MTQKEWDKLNKEVSKDIERLIEEKFVWPIIIAVLVGEIGLNSNSFISSKV